MNQKLNRMKQIFVALVLIASIAGFASCEKYSFTPPAVDPNTAWSLKTDIQPIFNASCVSCHGGAVSPDLRDGKSFNALSKGLYVSTPAESSRLYAKMLGGSHESKSTAAEKLKVLYWITQGAKNN